MTNELTIFNHEGENRIDSRLVAQSLEIEHRVIKQNIRRFMSDFEDIGKVTLREAPYNFFLLVRTMCNKFVLNWREQKWLVDYTFHLLPSQICLTINYLGIVTTKGMYRIFQRTIQAPHLMPLRGIS
jgi:hypothetical protein